MWVFFCFLHPSAYLFLSVLPSNTNGNIFYKRSKIKLFQWYILPPFFSKKQLLSANRIIESNELAVRYQHSLALLVLQPQRAHVGEVTCHSPKCLPSGRVAIPFARLSLLSTRFSFLAMAVSSLYDIFTGNAVKLTDAHSSQNSLLYLTVFSMTNLSLFSKMTTAWSPPFSCQL